MSVPLHWLRAVCAVAGGGALTRTIETTNRIIRIVELLLRRAHCFIETLFSGRSPGEALGTSMDANGRRQCRRSGWTRAFVHELQQLHGHRV